MADTDQNGPPTSGLPRLASRLPKSRMPMPLSATQHRSALPTSKLPASTSLTRPEPVVENSTGTPSRLAAPSRILRPASSLTGLAQAATSGDAQTIISTPSRLSRIGKPLASTPVSTSKMLARPKVQTKVPQSTTPQGKALNGRQETAGLDATSSGNGSSTSPATSLAERTMETLARIPSSPAVRGRPSMNSFYENEQPTPKSSRPSSRHSRPGSSHYVESLNRMPAEGRTRAGSTSSRGEENRHTIRAPALSYKAPLTPIDGTPTRKVSATSLRTSMSGTPGASLIKPPSASRISKPRSRTPSPVKKMSYDTLPVRGANTVNSRMPKPRASLNGLFNKAAAPALKKPATIALGSRKVSATSPRSSLASDQDPVFSTSSSASTLASTATTDAAASANGSKSSAALREQIARARAAKRSVATHKPSSSQSHVGVQVPLVPTDTSFDFGLAANNPDPFNQNRDEGSMAKVVQSRTATARTTGRLNIAALGLKAIPLEVMNMYESSATGIQDGSWAEAVDVTRLVAADNELEVIDDAVFPDVDLQAVAFNADDDFAGSIFAGLEMLDLHGNVLKSIPIGLRRLSMLTSLNLSKNKLTNDSLETIGQITVLKELNLAENLLQGTIGDTLKSLVALERLDLNNNNITDLSSSISELTHLRVLNLNENSFEALPFQLLASLPLTGLTARKNKLKGSLIQEAIEGLPALRTLDVASNQLTGIVGPGAGTLSMPALTDLCMTMNRLQSLAEITTWTTLTTLAAAENSIKGFPDGFCAMANLRSVNLEGNDIRMLPAEIARMKTLVTLRLNSNPLRDRKLVAAPIDELKAVLAARLEPVATDSDQDVQDDHFARRNGGQDEHKPDIERQSEAVDNSHSEAEDFSTPPTSAPLTPTRPDSGESSQHTWPVTATGVLDRSNTKSASLHPVTCSQIAHTKDVREIQLHHNLFNALPDSLSFFAATLTSLSLAHNQLVGESYLGNGDKLELPHLRELNLSSNHITSLMPIITHLKADALDRLDVSINRIPSLPPAGQLRAAFPRLSTLLIANNHLVDLNPDSIRGLSVVDAASNDIAHLNPKLGLLGGTGGLKRLVVTGNRFRVPRWNVLERGSEATLRWLRGRVPVTEAVAWREAEGGELGSGGDDDVD